MKRQQMMDRQKRACEVVGFSICIDRIFADLFASDQVVRLDSIPTQSKQLKDIKFVHRSQWLS